jgi:UDP-N-acetylglucosamine--N-acetylmuramyl-(pentapeptide) pyrophosphoryl-undecaprenol N-acetylglucosamine transferase
VNIAIACGGTGGHIFPGVATAAELQARGHAVRLWLAGKDVETPALRGWKGETTTVDAEGLPSGFSLRAVRASARLAWAVAACRTLMKQNPPDVVLGMGSYASVGPVLAAVTLKIPIVLHEANVVPGRAILWLSRWARAVAVSFEDTKFYLPNRPVVVTGMPVRPEVERAAQRGRTARMLNEPWSLLVMGGSRGARRLNEVVSAALVRLHQRGYSLRVVHLTGPADEQTVRHLYETNQVLHDVRAFASDMAAILSSVDVAICRAGAATCAELALMGLPALLVPYPFAARDHQMYNARAMEKAGAADVVHESDLSEDWLVSYLAEHFERPDRWKQMAQAMKLLGGRSAAQALADLVIAAAGGQRHAARA